MSKGQKGISNRINNYQCIEYYTSRFPHLSLEQCDEMRRQKIASTIRKRPSNTGISNPAHSSKTTIGERRKRSPMCIEYWMWKYPEYSIDECMQLLNDHKNKIRLKLKDKTNQPKCVEYWLARGYSEVEARQIISNSQKTFSLVKCIEKYGEVEGKNIFNERQQKWQKSLRSSFGIEGDKRSTQSNLARNIIQEICNNLHISYPKSEKYITSQTNEHYAYDFQYHNKLIEINGDYWHCNPKLYDEDFVNKVKNMTAKEIWEYDVKKAQCAHIAGYELLVIWEYDYYQDPESIIKKCIDFLNDK